ncbi:uncharacterized protein [Dysidea avara]|uniref:uncharacterized protein isoform X1 n=1 Tax=Dysidea avara TaxID=196820 RepID=UPI003328F841
MAAASFKESGSDHMWTVLFFFHGVVQRHLLIILTAGRNYRLGLSSRKFFLLLTSVCGNWSHFFWEPVSFLHTFYQQLTAATSSGTVNELSAFKNLFHLVCPYFTDHARIANKILFQFYLVITRFLDLVISVSDASCELT